MTRLVSNCKVLFIFLLVSLNTPAQESRGAIPEKLKSSLDSRLALFTQAQAVDDWEQVATLLGPYRRSGGLEPYSKHHKECLISQMKTMPMTAFTMEDYSYSTEILSGPLSNRWWYLKGSATFRTSEREQRQTSSLVAYRYRGEWYFTPPNYDEMWEQARLTEAELEADHAGEILLRNEPSSPLQITDLHAFIDRKYRSLLNLEFALNNVSEREIKGLTVLLFTKTGSTSFSTGAQIEPRASFTVTKFNSSRYVYACEESKKHTLIVESVRFADGSEWSTPIKH
jgi:hypothetical protein